MIYSENLYDSSIANVESVDAQTNSMLLTFFQEISTRLGGQKKMPFYYAGNTIASIPIIRMRGGLLSKKKLESGLMTISNTEKTNTSISTMTKSMHVSKEGSKTFKFRRNMYGVLKGKVIEVEANSAKEALNRLSRRTGWETKYFKEVTE